MTRQIFAAYDDQGVFVYQAFKPAIVAAALSQGTFDKGFNMQRMPWIKPSFGWMLYRSGYASKHRQEAIIRIKLRHEGFQAILSRAVPTTFDSRRYRTNEEWRQALDCSELRVQWDPDRDLTLRPLKRRAIQLGLEGETVRQYVEQWIVGLEDATPLAHAVKAAVEQKTSPPPVPEERAYELDVTLQTQLGIED